MPLHDALSSPSVRPSITHTLNRIMKQVEYDCFTDIRTRRIDPLYKELCLIIAEVFVMDPNTVMKVNGVEMTTGLVQEVFEQLRNDHIQLVFANYQEVTHRVYNKKAYLRTALYNAVYELESHSLNSWYFK